jgi:protein required for attachment to host cells
VPRSQCLLIVVFDAAKARFFKQEADGRIRPEAKLNSDLHAHTRDEMSDKPGRVFSSVGGVRHAYEYRSDPHKYEKHKFVHKLVTLLDNIHDKGLFTHLVIVAPKRSLGEFHDIASPRLNRLVLREISKEFTKFSDHELEERLRPYVGSDMA